MPDDHYCCKICGQFHCVCAAPPRTPSSAAQAVITTTLLKSAQEKLRGIQGFKPTMFVQDFRDNSATWRFETPGEAEAFARAVHSLMTEGD